MSSIDQRIVQMQFDNAKFEQGAKTSMSTLEKLKSTLNFDKSVQSLSKLQNAGNKINFSGLASGVETISARFTNLGIVGVAALTNITNAAINAGTQMVKSLTLDPVLSGFTEYETKMNSITTILTNTATKGTTLDDVNKALDELNTYADQTIYNFAEMTRNIGTFTAAGVDLDSSVKAIKGIANLAAGSGSTSAQASTAMYQLSQALAAGRVSLQDWNSVVNAGMGGELFQNALKETAKQMGIVVDESVSFRDSLSTTGGKESWLTSDVLIKTLEKFADDKTLVKAATQVKTVTQLFDTMGESVQSGWAQSWEYIIGNREQAVAALTAVSDAFNNLIQPSTDARNAMLKFWNENGGRDAIIEAISNAFNGLMDVMSPIHSAFQEIFPPMTGEKLVDISKKVLELSKNFKVSDTTAKNLNRTFKGIFSAIQMVGKGASAVLKPLLGVTDGFGSIGATVLETTAEFGDFLTELNKSESVEEAMKKISTGLGKGIDSVNNFIKSVFTNTGDVSDHISDFAGKIIDVLESAASKFGDIIEWIGEHISFGDIFAGLAGGGIFILAKKLAGVFGNIQEAVEGFLGDDNKVSSLTENFSDILSSVHDSLDSFSTGIKVGSLITIAAAIGILSASLNSIAKLNVKQIGKGLTAIGVMIAELNLGFRSITKSINKFDSKGVIRAGVSLMTIAGAVVILAQAAETFSGLSLEEIGKGLAGVGGSLLELTGAIKIIGKSKVSLSTSVAIVALAESCKILAEAVESFGNMSWEEIARGLAAMGGALTELTASVSVLGKFGGIKSLFGSASILIVTQGLNDIYQSLKDFGNMRWEEIGKGLAAMGGALGEISFLNGALGKISGISSPFASGSILMVTQGLADIYQSLKDFGSMDWEEIGKGLTAMGGALGELGIVSGALGKISGFSGILGSGSVLIAVQALEPIAETLKNIGALTWEEITKGLVGMGGALTELSLFSGALGKISGFSGILGSGSILIAVQALDPISSALSKISELSWTDIVKGLTGMGAALLEVATFSGALGKIAPIGGILGSGAILIGVQGLGDIADAMQKFSGMSWEDIGKALVAMGGALTELAVIPGILGKVAPLAGIIGSGSILIAVQGLGDLADSLQKFGSMSWDEIGRGLSAMAGAMGATGLGGLLNTLSGFGAAAIADIAPALSALADSMQKWSTVTVPENLGYQLGSLADGVMDFTFGGFGAGALTSAAPGIGAMADAIKKWQNVTVPEGIESGLKGIAKGVKSFNFGFLGGWSIGEVTGPLSDLAVSVKKWNGVIIPEGIGSKLKNLADGIGAFGGSFIAGWSIAEVVEPLSKLAISVRQWNTITLPEGIGTQLSSLASGIGKFSDLNVNQESLIGIASGIRSIGSASVSLSGINFGIIASGIQTMIATVSSIPSQLSAVSSSVISSANSIKIAVGSIAVSVSSQAPVIIAAFTQVMNGSLNAVTSRAGQFSNAGSMVVLNLTNGMVSNLLAGIPRIRNGTTQLVNTMTSTINSGSASVRASAVAVIQNMASGMMSQLSVSTALLQNSARTMTTQLVNTIVTVITTNIPRAQNAMRQLAIAIINTAQQIFTSSYPRFRQFGTQMMSNLESGARSRQASVISVFRSTATSAASAASGYYGSFYSAGVNMMSGLASGIRAGQWSAINAAASAAASAYAAAKRQLDIHSPSKKFEWLGRMSDEGLGRGFLKYAGVIQRGASRAADVAYSGMESALTKITSILNDNIDASPVIRPVMDLSDVSRGASLIDSLLMNQNGTYFGGIYSGNTGRNLRAVGTMPETNMITAQTNNRDVVEAVNILGERMDLIAEEIRNMQVVLDTGATVGGISNKMNTELGRKEAYRRRNI